MKGLRVLQNFEKTTLPPMKRKVQSCAVSDIPEAWGQGIVYSVTSGVDHDWPGHKENAGRVTSVLDGLEDSGLSQIPSIRKLVFPSASTDSINLVHTTQYINTLARVVKEYAPVEVESAPTYVTSSSYDIVLNSCGQVLGLLDEVVEQSKTREPDCAFALVRPPGHHALEHGPMGFCIFNNATIAARHAQNVHGLKKIAIFDYDVHHGNGTDDAFASDPDVLFISAHQDGSYPMSGKAGRCGTGDGEGFTLNIPLPGDSGDSGYRMLWEEVVEPRIRAHAPDMIIVSAGYDAHWRDPLAGLQLRTSTYHWLCSSLRALASDVCHGRIVFVLEGGYDLKALSDSVCDSFRGVLGMPSEDAFNPELLREEPLDKVRAVIAAARSHHLQ